MQHIVQEFHGGITDLIETSPDHFSQFCDNLLITKQKKLEQRPGRNYFDESNPQYNSTATRISHIFSINDGESIFIQPSSNTDSLGTGTLLGGEVIGPWSTTASTASKFTTDAWNICAVMSNQEGAYPILFYSSPIPTITVTDPYTTPVVTVTYSTQEDKAHRLGLPYLGDMALTATTGGSSYYTYHYCFTRVKKVYDEDSGEELVFIDRGPMSSAQIGLNGDPSADNVSMTLGLGSVLIDTAEVTSEANVASEKLSFTSTDKFSLNKLYYIDDDNSAPVLFRVTAINAATGEVTFASLSGVVALATYTIAQNIKVYIYNGADLYSFADYGTTAEFLTVPASDDDKATGIYIFASITDFYVGQLAWIFDITVGRLQVSVTAIDSGTKAVTFKMVESGLTDFTVFNLATVEFYRANFSDHYFNDLYVDYYRSEENGTTPYLVRREPIFNTFQVAHALSSVGLSDSDDNLSNETPSYYIGDFLNHDEPPYCKFLAVNAGVTYYANVHYTNKRTQQVEYFSNRVVMSIRHNPNYAPESAFVELNGPIKGIKSIFDSTIVMTSSEISRIDGIFDAEGGGVAVPTTIHDTAGCTAHNSIVRTDFGLFWAGNNGFYWSDGAKCLCISTHLQDTYIKYTSTAAQKGRVYGGYDNSKKRVWWAMQSTSGSDSDTLFVVDCNFGISPMMPFTTVTGEDMNPTAITFEGENLVYGQSDGYLYKHFDSLLADKNSSDETDTIMYKYLSTGIVFGNIGVRKYVPTMTGLLRCSTNLAMTVISKNDIKQFNENGSNTIVDYEEYLKPVRYRNIFDWDEISFTEDNDYVWETQEIKEFKRFFKSESLRCTYKQVGFTNASVVVSNSDDNGTGTFGSTVTFTLDTGEFPEWTDGLAIYFEHESFATAHTISTVATDTVTFTPAVSVAPTGVQAWEVKGYGQDEKFSVVAYTINYYPLSIALDQYDASSSGTGEL